MSEERLVIAWLMSIIIIVALAAGAYGQAQVIAKDSVGVIVEISERYGARWRDTVTVVSLYAGQYVLTRRGGQSGWYPTGWHNVTVIGRLMLNSGEAVTDADDDN